MGTRIFGFINPNMDMLFDLFSIFTRYTLRIGEPMRLLHRISSWIRRTKAHNEYRRLQNSVVTLPSCMAFRVMLRIQLSSSVLTQWFGRWKGTFAFLILKHFFLQRFCFSREIFYFHKKLFFQTNLYTLYNFSSIVFVLRDLVD